ncbi:MAG TPA: TIGR03943 family protein [Actinomycetota bacterium]|nr:TIGR03943 family protein [Actinomycetota bacterium]
MRGPSSIKAVVLAVWAGFFVWLVASGEIYRYIGPRTYWVVVFGAVAAAAATLLIAITGRRTGGGVDLIGALAMLLPVVIVFAVPRPSLGALAASHKLSGVPITAGTFQPAALGPGEKVSFAEIEYASESSKYAATVGITDGYPVELTGFVTHPAGLAAGNFALTRFSIYCCAADAVPHSVTIAPRDDKSYPDDRWLTIEGHLQDVDGDYVLVPESIRSIEEPEDPYIR